VVVRLLNILPAVLKDASEINAILPHRQFIHKAGNDKMVIRVHPGSGIPIYLQIEWQVKHAVAHLPSAA
jgi:hypothetical protein